jgi:GH24 family phage-related lysozyme (muramidase)
MALNNYGRALGQIAQESVKGSVKGFAMGIKGAALREMPGLTAMYGLSREVKNRANKLGDASIEASVKEQRTNNVISIEMVRQLRSINNNVLQQTRISALQAQNAKQTAMFAEESDREKAQRDKELIDAIKSLKGGAGAGGALGSAGGAGGKGFLGSLLDAIQGASLLESIAGALGAYGLFKGGKTILGKGGAGGKVPTPPPTGGGGKVIPFPGGKAPTPPTGGGGLGGAAGMAGRGLLRFIPYVGWALLAAEVGYEAYKIFGSSGGQGPNGKKPQGDLGGGFDAMGNYTGGGNLGGGLSQAAQTVLKGKYAVGDARRRSTGVDYTGTRGAGMDAAQFITGKEGFSSKAYKDTNRMAIGYGHNLTDAEIRAGEIDLGGGDKIKIAGEGGKDTTVTKEQANKLFAKDLGRFESIVVASIGREAYNKLSANQKTAILSYVYNTGSVPKGFAEAIKSGNYAAAAASIRNGVANVDASKVSGWSKEKIQSVNASLKKRREDEAKLFDTAGGVTPEGRNVGGTTGGVTAKTSGNLTPVSRVAANDPTNLYTESNGLQVLRSELNAKTRSTSGSGLKLLSGPIQVEDKKANAIAVQQLKVSKTVARETAVVAKSTTPRETRRQTTLLQRANQTFLNQFQNTTQRLLSKAIYDTLVVGAYGREGSRNLVSRQQTQNEIFRGQQVANIVGLRKGTEKVLTGVFGKTIGKAYAPMVAQLGTAYLEVGATKVGRELFSNILGGDKNADALTGQILGNFARGNKQVATEQLLYGLTGIASGPETIFAKYGFGSSQQGTNFLGGMGAAQLTAPIAGMLGGNQPTYRGPGGQMYGANQYPMMQPATQQGAYYTGYNAKGNQQTFVNPEMMKLAIDADKASRESLPHISKGTWEALDQAKAATKEAEKQYLASEAGSSEYRIAQEAREQAQVREQQITNDILRTRPTAVGGGSSAGGNFMASMGNFAFDLGTSLVASKLTQNIKNPYLKAFANFGISSAASSFIRPMLFGAPTAAGAAASAAPSLFSTGNVASLGSSLMPSSTLGFAGTAGNILANSGYTTAGNFMSGVQSGLNLTTGVAEGAGYAASGVGGASAAGEMFGQALPYAAAIVKLLQGDVKGAALTAAGTYAGMKIGAYFGPTGVVVGAILGSILGGSIGRKPKPAVLRVIGTTGNEVSASTTWAKDSPPDAWSKFADTILVALFNSAKLMQQMSGGTLSFTNIGVYVDSQSGISLCLYKEGESTNTSSLPQWNKNFGSIGDFKLGTALKGMIEFMRDCLKEGKDTITADKLDKATTELKSKNITAITSGVLNELKTGGQYDLSKGVGYDSGKPTSTGRTAGEAKTRVGAVNLGSINDASNVTSLTAARGTTSATTLVPTSQNTTNVSNMAPTNSVVAVGGSSQVDNSMSVTNINQISTLNDPWRKGSVNTDYVLAA